MDTIAMCYAKDVVEPTENHPLMLHFTIFRLIVLICFLWSTNFLFWFTITTSFLAATAGSQMNPLYAILPAPNSRQKPHFHPKVPKT